MPAAEEWPELPDDSAVPTQTHAWMSARFERPLGRQWEVFVVGAEARKRAVAILCRKGNWLRELFLMFEPSDFVWSDAASLQELADIVTRQGLPLYLERLPATSPTLAALRKAVRGRDWIVTQPAMPTPYIDLTDRTAESCLNAGRRSDLRRAERRAAQFGQVAHELIAPSSKKELDKLIEEAFDVETRSWKYAAGTAAAQQHSRESFGAPSGTRESPLWRAW